MHERGAGNKAAYGKKETVFGQDAGNVLRMPPVCGMFFLTALYENAGFETALCLQKL